MRINTNTNITLNKADAVALSRVRDILDEIKYEFVMQTLTENGTMVDAFDNVIINEEDIDCAMGTLYKLFMAFVSFDGSESKTTLINFKD